MGDVPVSDHGHFEPKPADYCVGRGTALVDFLSANRPMRGRALDVGCAGGALGSHLLARGFSEVIGIEPVPAVAERARDRISEVLVGTFQSTDLAALGHFDLIVFGDSLEHMLDPWAALRQARTMLAPDGALLLSVPNIAHWSVLWRALKLGRWDYRDEGLLDRTHLRFFTPVTLAEALADAGFRIVVTQANEKRLPKRRRWMRPLLSRFAPHTLVFQQRVIAVPV